MIVAADAGWRGGRNFSGVFGLYIKVKYALGSLKATILISRP